MTKKIIKIEIGPKEIREPGEKKEVIRDRGQKIPEAFWTLCNTIAAKIATQVVYADRNARECSLNCVSI